jgi:hypothetical protein
MLIKDIFAADITRDIAPVIYFHEQDPQKVLSEVSEYIITGGYAEGDPRKKRIQSGIHEQFVKLLRSLAKELGKKSGSELPAVWISGFYGSGKSSFAKLLGLSLDNLELPNHRLLADALLERDDSPQKDEFKEAWHKVRSSIDPIAVVFDIGSVAREGEQIHSAVKREIQKRLGYCPINYVADFELKLELDGKWEDFLRCAGEALDKSWVEIRQDKLADEDFSQVMHQLEPEKYLDPMSWYDSHVASDGNSGSSVSETVSAIAAMLNHRAVGKTLFVVIDEVSQYIYQNDTRMLKLQSFVADLGQKLKGKVWLLATGQQKLEDNDDESNIGKLKDRFPPYLRVHLDPANIRDVVHKRLLKKAPTKEAELRSLFQQHRSDLKLYGYGCESITEEDFLEVYPLLPGYIDLLMQIASSLRVRSARVKGDDYAIRGLLQLLGDLFREQNLAEKELGELITLDRIYDIQGSSLDADMQNTLTRLFAYPEVTNNEVAIKVAKVVALLELIQEQQATTPELIGKCLYQRMGMGNAEPEIQQALEKLRNLGLISYSEKLGYKIQSSTGQEWQRERDEYGVTNQQISEVISDKLKDLVGSVDNPRYKGKSFRWTAFYSDDRAFQDKRLQKTTDLDVITVDFRYLTKKEERADEVWIQQSASENYQDRILWVIGALETLPDKVRELARSQNMIKRYGSRIQSIPPDKQRLYFEEQSRYEELEKQVKNAIAERFMSGQIYFRGRTIGKHQFGNTFAVVLKGVGESILPTLYEKYVDIAITDTELQQLLEKELSGISDKFMSQNLGIFELDAGKYQPSCKGDVPSRVLQYLTDNNGSGGTNLLQHFGGSPFGYGSDVVKACVAGLLRAGKIRIRPESGSDITSMRDPGTKDIFTKDSQFKRADILLQSGEGINGKDRNKICQFFQESLNVELDRENDAIADAVFQQFTSRVRALQELEAKYNQLPNRPELPETLIKLRQALENCTRSRQVEDTVIAVKKHLDALQDGIQQLGIINAELTEEKIKAVRQACEIQNHQLAQLKEIGKAAEVTPEIQAIKEHLNLERPWRDIESLEPHLKIICDRYREIRLELINQQEQEAQKIEINIKRRNGFDRLSEEKSSKVLNSVKKARCQTTDDALYPRLLELRDTTSLKQAEQEANEKLDRALAEETQIQVVTFDITKILINREIASQEEVEPLVTELRDRLLSQLKKGVRIRIT